jgi:hypothetical protein
LSRDRTIESFVAVVATPRMNRIREKSMTGINI